MSDRAVPDDLIPIAEAERISERSAKTLRRWVKTGRLHQYKGDPPARGGSAPGLYSRGELLALLATSGQQPQGDTSSKTQERTEAPRRPLAEHLQDEVVRLRSALALKDAEIKVAKLETENVGLQDRVADLEERLQAAKDGAELLRRTSREDIERERLQVNDMRDQRDKAQAELAALKQAQRVTWWQRLLGGPTGG